MIELKTLKDLIGRRAPLLNVNVELLRQEAIKEIKYLTKIGRCPIIGIEDSETVGAIVYIKWKNNITEEDLKDGP